MDLGEPPWKRQRTNSRRGRRVKPWKRRTRNRESIWDLQRLEIDWGFWKGGFTFEKGWIGKGKQEEVFFRRPKPGSDRTNPIIMHPDFLKGDYRKALKKFLQRGDNKSVTIEYRIDRMEYGEQDKKIVYISRCKQRGIEGEGYGSSRDTAVQEAALDLIQKLGFATEEDIEKQKSNILNAIDQEISSTVLPRWMRVDRSCGLKYMCIACNSNIGNNPIVMEQHRKGKRHKWYMGRFGDRFGENTSTTSIADDQTKIADDQTMRRRANGYVCYMGQLPSQTSISDVRNFVHSKGVNFTNVLMGPGSRKFINPDSFCWVEAASRKDYEKLLALNGTNYRGGIIRIEHAVKKRAKLEVLSADHGQKWELSTNEDLVKETSTVTPEVSSRPSPIEPKKKERGQASFIQQIKGNSSYKLGNYKGALIELFRNGDFKGKLDWTLRKMEGSRVVVATCRHTGGKYQDGIGTAYRKNTAMQFASLDFMIKMGLVTMEDHLALLHK